MTDKAALRRAVREEAKRHSAEERRLVSARLCALLRGQSLWRAARSVLLFVPMADEPDISPLLHAAINEGKTVALPAYAEATGTYEARQVREPLKDLSAGRFGIAEPCAACAPIPLAALDLILVPGLAFTLAGVRLGRGKGFYDRLLAQTTGVKCAIAFDWQVRDEIPDEAHDVIVDFLATPSRVWNVKERAECHR